MKHQRSSTDARPRDSASVRRLLPSLATLEFFDAAARHLSFTKAAAELSVTQGAISRQIRMLEDRIGQQLFLRLKRALTLTPVGVEYSVAVRSLLQHAESTTMGIFGPSDAPPTLSIAVLPTFGSRWLAPRLTSFRRLHPDIHLTIRTYIEPFIFANSDADVAIHCGTDSWPGATCVRLMGEVSVAVAAPSLLHGVPEKERLHRLPLLQHTTRSAAWLQLFAQLGLPANLALRGPRFDHFYMMIQAAAAGLGISLLPEFLVEQELRSGALTRAIPNTVESDRAYWIAYPDERAEVPAIKCFRDWLLAQISGAAT
jgi:LysR family transcriptional regulator, glycine cleavage system transcriptional activator